MRTELCPVGSGRRKPLEVNDKNLGPPLEGVPLGALLLLLARLTRRLLVAVQRLLGNEQLKISNYTWGLFTNDVIQFPRGGGGRHSGHLIKKMRKMAIAIILCEIL